MMTDRLVGQTLLLSSNKKSCLDFRLVYLHLTWDHSNGQDQCHAHFNCEYIMNGDRQCKRYYCHKYYYFHKYNFKYLLLNGVVCSCRPMSVTSFRFFFVKILLTNGAMTVNVLRFALTGIAASWSCSF